MPADQSAEFKKAAEEVQKLNEKPSQDELLKIYALFKQGTQDPPFEEAKKPGLMDIQGKYKRSEWEKLVKEGVTPEQAQKRYVELVESLKSKIGVQT